MRFGGMKFKINFKETPRNITKIRVLTKSKVFFLEKILNIATFKFVKCVIITITSLKVQIAKYLVDLYLKSVGKQVQGNRCWYFLTLTEKSATA